MVRSNGSIATFFVFCVAASAASFSPRSSHAATDFIYRDGRLVTAGRCQKGVQVGAGETVTSSAVELSGGAVSGDQITVISSRQEPAAGVQSADSTTAFPLADVAPYVFAMPPSSPKLYKFSLDGKILQLDNRGNQFTYFDCGGKRFYIFNVFAAGEGRDSIAQLGLDAGGGMALLGTASVLSPKKAARLLATKPSASGDDKGGASAAAPGGTVAGNGEVAATPASSPPPSMSQAQRQQVFAPSPPRAATRSSSAPSPAPVPPAPESPTKAEAAKPPAVVHPPPPAGVPGSAQSAQDGSGGARGDGASVRGGALGIIGGGMGADSMGASGSGDRSAGDGVGTNSASGANSGGASGNSAGSGGYNYGYGNEYITPAASGPSLPSWKTIAPMRSAGAAQQGHGTQNSVRPGERGCAPPDRRNGSPGSGKINQKCLKRGGRLQGPPASASRGSGHSIMAPPARKTRPR